MKGYHKTWWGQAFVRSLEEFIDPGRLQRGRAYRTPQRILAFDMADNVLTATVRGNINPYFGVAKEPRYQVVLSFSKIPESHWKQCIGLICKNPGWLSKLMLNEIPEDIQSIFEPYDFLPRSYQAVQATCSCPDDENPCKHIAGVYYHMAELLDVMPMILFTLRGIPTNELQAALKQSELGQALAQHLSLPADIQIEYDPSYFPVVEALSQESITPQSFWGAEDALKNFVTEESIQTPIVGALIKKQGDYPPFWNKQTSFVSAMEAIYEYIKRKHRNSLGSVV